ncbi:hypothetical protein BDZ88DRAFT_431559 [Geranomyces variabilis]|nr:hypothetical protein BDZ88DRAFT_431559 [Geranomyces variabilis]
MSVSLTPSTHRSFPPRTLPSPAYPPSNKVVPVLTLFVHGLPGVSTLNVEDTTGSKTVRQLAAQLSSFLCAFGTAGVPQPTGPYYDCELFAGEKPISIDGSDGARPVSYFDAFSASLLVRVHDDPRQLFVKTTSGKTITINTAGFHTIEKVKKMIEAKESIALDQQRLIHGGRQLEEDHKTLIEFGINTEATLHLAPRVRGGKTTPLSFVDLSNPAVPERIEWSTSAPKWRFAGPGMTLEGRCNNGKCQAFRKTVIANLRFGEYNPAYDYSRSKCPMCAEFIDSQDCGFAECKYRYQGLRLDEHRQPKRESVSWTTVAVGDQYQRFSSSKLGTSQWLSLVIEAKPLGAQTETSPECLACGMEIAAGYQRRLPEWKLPCQHIFHARCVAPWIANGHGCPVCNIARGDKSIVTLREV